MNPAPRGLSLPPCRCSTYHFYQGNWINVSANHEDWFERRGLDMSTRKGLLDFWRRMTSRLARLPTAACSNPWRSSNGDSTWYTNKLINQLTNLPPCNLNSLPGFLHPPLRLFNVWYSDIPGGGDRTRILEVNRDSGESFITFIKEL